MEISDGCISNRHSNPPLPVPTVRSRWSSSCHRSNGLASDCTTAKSVKRSHPRCSSIRSQGAPVMWHFRRARCCQSPVATLSAEHSVLGFLTSIRTTLESNIHDSGSALDASCSHSVSSMHHPIAVASAAHSTSTSIVSSSERMRHRRKSRMLKLKLRLAEVTGDRTGTGNAEHTETVHPTLARDVATRTPSICVTMDAVDLDNLDYSWELPEKRTSFDDDHSAHAFMASDASCSRMVSNMQDPVAVASAASPSTFAVAHSTSTSIVSSSERMCHRRKSRMLKLKLRLAEVTGDRTGTGNAEHTETVHTTLPRDVATHHDTHSNCDTMDAVKLGWIEMDSNWAPRCLTWYHRRIAKVRAAKDRHRSEVMVL